MGTAENQASFNAEESRTVPPQTCMLITAALGASLLLISTFLPWGTASPYMELPPQRYLSAIIHVARAATVIAWAGIALHEWVENPEASHIAVAVASALSFLSAGLFASTGIPLSWGAYISLAGGALLALSIILEKLDFTIVLEVED